LGTPINLRKAEIARLEDHGAIVDGLFKSASTPKEYGYALLQRSLNALLLWKHKRLQSKDDAKSRAIKGAIYVHSKVIIVDEALAMIGSNNINERSMWHDSENAVMFRAMERESMPAKLRGRLFEIMVGNSMKGRSSQMIFELFSTLADNNAKILKQGGLEGHVVRYMPEEVAAGSSVLS
jgi:phosphatidylserine/phosphatidylglycerophosphate/cardiolipin synthase-like enzyme